jgi:hypothetical protein
MYQSNKFHRNLRINQFYQFHSELTQILHSISRERFTFQLNKFHKNCNLTSRIHLMFQDQDQLIINHSDMMMTVAHALKLDSQLRTAFNHWNYLVILRVLMKNKSQSLPKKSQLSFQIIDKPKKNCKTNLKSLNLQTSDFERSSWKI